MMTWMLAILLATSLHKAPSPLAGTWQLTGADEVRSDGSVVEPYGAHPEGLLLIDDEGRYSLQIFRSDRSHFASNDKRKGTPTDYESAVLGMSSHYGRCEVDAREGVLVFHIERASYPNWDGTVQRRSYVLKGDDLAYEIPSGAAGGVTPRSRWRRVER